MKIYEVWYMRPRWFRNGIFGERPKAASLFGTHVHLKNLELDGDVESNLEKIFHDMQGEVWSPNGEARELIIEKGLAHTSMSVGDVVRVDGEIYLVANLGFEKL